MAAHPRPGPSAPVGGRKLRVEEARFYASVYSSARKGSLNELRRKGCSEEEAEEHFSVAFEKVMETVDPIAREFSAAQMVSFIKRACWRCLIDERRRRGLRPEVELSAIRSLSDASVESPDEIAEEREAVAIGREALQMLSKRDRMIFRQRHQMNLSPEEIVQNIPGLSLRTYRKLIQRANTRVLDALERIEGGKRCEEMEASLLRRYVTDESPEAERHAIEAHLAHCRACQQAQAQMRGYLLDVASGLLAASSSAGSSRVDPLGSLAARLVELASNGAQALGEASRALRERIRDALFRAASGLPGSGGDATVGQALTASSVKVASACAAGIAAGACVAAGVIPGIGGIGLLNHHQESKAPARSTVHMVPASERPSLIDTLPTPNSAAGKQTNSSPRKRVTAGARHASEPSTPTSQAAAPASNSPSSARVSGSQTGSEFGAESGQPAPPSEAPAPSSSPSGSSGSSSLGSGGSLSKGSGSEFGL